MLSPCYWTSQTTILCGSRSPSSLFLIKRAIFIKHHRERTAMVWGELGFMIMMNHRTPAVSNCILTHCFSIQEFLKMRKDFSSCLFCFVFCHVEKSVPEVPDNPVNMWEESRVEDELSPEEIQMVWHLRRHYLVFMSCCICRFVCFMCIPWMYSCTYV